MPPDRNKCSECGKTHLACPECGENTVSVDCIHTGDYPPGETSLSPEFNQFGLYAEEDEVLKYRIFCWECGYDEKRTLSVEIE